MPRDGPLLEPAPGLAEGAAAAQPEGPAAGHALAARDASAARHASVARRILAVWLPSLPTDRLHRRLRAKDLRAKGKPPDRPLVLTGEQNGRPVITALDRAAAAEGIRLGMPVTDARALVPELKAMDARPEADARALAGLADWATRYTPWAAPAGREGLFLDISGCAHLFGGEEALLADARTRLEGFGYAARLAIADTPGAAWAMARSGAPARAGLAARSGGPKNCIVPPGKARRALGALSVEGLRLPARTLEDLRRLGLHRIGDLARLPRGSVTKRFGAGVLLRLDQALDRVGEPISPSLPVIPHAVRMAFAEPIGRAEDVSAALDRLLERLCKGLEEAREGARRLTFALYRVDGAVIRREAGTARPVRDAKLLARLFAEKLDDIDAGFGFETLVLSASVTQRLALAQAELSEQAALRAADALADLAERAAARFGPGSVTRLAPRQSHLPERAVVSLPLEVRKPGEIKTTHSSEGARPASKPYPGGVPSLVGGPHPGGTPSPGEDPSPGGTPGPGEGPGPGWGWPAEWRRPIHLFAEPQPIEAVAPVPDDPPALFRWRGRTHPVALAEGPERIAPEWWVDGPGAASARPRDYYRVEDVAGRRFWLFRHGLYGQTEGQGRESAGEEGLGEEGAGMGIGTDTGASANPPRWFLHGLFG